MNSVQDKYSNIIDNLIILRKNKRLSQKDLVKATNLAQPAIARMENKRAVPQLDTLIKVSEALVYIVKLVPLNEV